MDWEASARLGRRGDLAAEPLYRQEGLPPHDTDAEEAVLGSLLIDDEVIHKVASSLKPEDFYREKNRWIYEACLALYERNEAINQITVAYELASLGHLEEGGGAAYLSDLVATLPTAVHVEHYAQIVRRTALLRRLIGAAGEIARMAYRAGPDVEGALARAEEILYRLRQGERVQDFVLIKEVLSQYLEASSLAPAATRAVLPHVATGFVDLDKLLGRGFKRSDLAILAARPSFGKTSLALNIAVRAALYEGATIGIFSLEMSKEQLVHRLLASQARVDSQRIRLDDLTREEEQRIVEAMGRLAEAAIYVDDSPQLRVMEMRSRARRLHSERPLDLLIVDYLQLVQGSGRSDNRVQEMSDISRSLKGLARELDVPLLAVSQLSRAVESRAEHIPVLADLRESGSIEQDADVVLFLYRPDAYYTEKQWKELHATDGQPYPKGRVEVIVAKHRNGPTGQIPLTFRAETNTFGDYPPLGGRRG